jgi:hypothetical protein
LLYVIPGVAAAIAAYALIGPGKPRPVMSARVFGTPDDEGRLRSVRVAVAQREEQRDRPLSGDVVVEAGGLSASATAGASGVAELRFEQPIRVGDELRISIGGHPIGRDTIERGDVDDAAIGVSTAASGQHDGSLRVTAHLLRGPLIPPFADVVAIDVEDARGAPIAASSKVTFDGASCSACSKPIEGKTHFEVEVMPIADTIEVEIDAHAGAQTGRFSGKLPVALGSLFLDRDSTGKHLEILAANPKPAAFVSLFDKEGRTGGAVVPLTERGDGFLTGTLDIDAGEPAATFAIVSSDDRESGRSATAWRIDPKAEEPALRRVTKVFDGFPAATKRENDRLRTTHRVLAAFIAALALLEVVLLGVLARTSRRDLSKHFAETLEAIDDPENPTPIQPVRSTLLIVGVVALLVVISAAAVITLTFVAG